jgi:hypothetical protein
MTQSRGERSLMFLRWVVYNARCEEVLNTIGT